MKNFNLRATAAFGIESIVGRELGRLGIEEIQIENGGVSFIGDYTAIAKANIWLRCADRILIKIASFRATDFEELFVGTKNIEWGDLIPENGIIHVIGKSTDSRLHSVPDCQAIVKKAIVESMKKKYKKEWFDETGSLYRIQISLRKDIAEITLDTSGQGLHKRGYRLQQGDAPLKETLAAAIVYLSRWTPDRIFCDPMCGSGTIPIEAALIGRNIAPGLNRKFSSEEWPDMPSGLWNKVREDAYNQIANNELQIYASDNDYKVFTAAVNNAKSANISDSIIFQKKPLQEFSSKKKSGCIVCNPPYGERLKVKQALAQLYKDMNFVFSELDDWSYFILTSDTNFPKYFGRKPDKNRKLYNGRIQVYLYQYFGVLPLKKKKPIQESN